MTAAHAVYAPSDAHTWIHCTASAEAKSRLPTAPEREEADAGTEAHEEIERCIEVLPTGDLYLYDPPDDHPAHYGISLFLDYVAQLPLGRAWIEQCVKLTPEIWGRPDFSHWHEETLTLTIPDYKDGFVDVQAVKNPQLRIYAGATIVERQLPAKWIRYAIVQPNSIVPGPRIKQWTESAEDLHAFCSHVAAIPTGPKEFRFGAHCRYCRLFGLCPASRDVLADLSVAISTLPEHVRPEQAATLLAAQKPIADWFKALEKTQTKNALAGTVPPGMKLVTGTKHRDWKDQNEARMFVFQARGIEALEPPTPAQAEKLGLDVSQLASKPEGGPVLAFESDARKPWVPKTAAEMFADALAQKG